MRREGKALGWDVDAINELLKEGGNGGTDGESWQSSKRSAKDEPDMEDKSEKWDVKEYWGIAKVEDLKEYNVEIDEKQLGFKPDPNDYIECCLVVSGSHVLKATL